MWSGVNWLGTGLVGLMFLIFLFIGWLGSKKAKSQSAEELILAGRGMPLWIAVMTMTATWIDGGYINGTAEQTFRGSITWAFQPGFCFGLSLILGGIFFAKKMRSLELTTLIDPFEAKYGRIWGAVLFIPAMLGELFWSAALLAAISSTFHVLLHLDLTTSMIVAATVVTFYTMAGGMWSVAYTDTFQLLLIPIGLTLAIPFALQAVGGWDAAWGRYEKMHPGGTGLFPPGGNVLGWTTTDHVSWWDACFLLVLGGIPWNCYFQRVLSCRTPDRARWHSILSGGITILLTVPPMILGVIAATAPWAAPLSQQLAESPANALPLVFRDLTPTVVGLVGLVAILGAVVSSYSSSILSAGTMTTWNVYRPLISPKGSAATLRIVLRLVILLLAVCAVLLALNAKGSVYTLWTFSADLIFVLLFPQLLWALYDPRANRIGSMTAFAVSLIIRVGGGEPEFHLPWTIDFPAIFEWLLPGPRSMWYQAGENGSVEKMLFPYKTLAAAMGIILIPIVSRLTARWDPPCHLKRVKER